jgi:hypothetical protein
MRRIFRMSALVALSVVVFAPAVFAADAATHMVDRSTAYVWFAEGVSIDHAAGTLAAKARLRYDVLPEYDQFKSGDRFTLQWYTSAWGETEGIQHLARKEQIDGIGLYVMPADFVALDRPSKTVTFRIPIKGDVLRTLKSLSPPASIRVTSRYWPAPEDDTIITVDTHDAKIQPSAGD